ncbi:hypothetical protein Q3O60_00630 [Alkalimonas collagenimarina]|uniref:Uncharacterized protein n=1 Tax=Alkalimonas collagenimarina TaxID=400390 RepID=A0ABT9GUZ5_9GAMM|nr:hypothetical protein [Alkalimonas collagenimarina]MDP4534699.1 hypothetical protein [Alkalimonas collagenimarina]
MDILNNREIAIAFWLFAISIYIFSASRMVEVRKAFRNLLSAFFVKQIISVLSLMITYMVIVIYFLSELDLWNIGQLKNTLFWCASVGFMSLFKLESIKKDKSFFQHSVIDNLKLLAILQFIVSVYTFPLWVEVLLVPILVLISAMLAIAERDNKYHQVKALLEYCLAFFGITLIAHTAYMLTVNFISFGNEKTAYDFFVPPLLTLCYLPFVFVMLVYSTYEQVFIRLQFSIKRRLYRNLAELYALVLFNIDIKLLERWSYQVARVNIESHDDLIESFKHMFRVRSAEKHPKDVPSDLGWSPYEAKEFLSKEGLGTGFYDRVFEEEWCASSPMVDFGDGIIPANIAFYVEGSKEVASSLKIMVNVNDATGSQIAREKLLELANALSHSSFNQYLSDKMKNAILEGRPISEECENKTISLTMNLWPGHRFNGYDINFIVSSI